MRKISLLLLLLWAALFTNGAARAQALDPSFTPTVVKGGFVFGVRALQLQPDGKALVAGEFDFAGGTLSNRVLRLNVNGTRDASFQTTAGALGMVDALAVQTDGKILIGGTLAGYNGVNTASVARLNTDGTLDASFVPDPALNLRGQTLALAIQADGKILAVGSYSAIGSGAALANIVRLNPDGSLDTSFAPGTGAGNSTGGGIIFSVLVQADGKIVVGGSFVGFNGAAINNLARLNPDGSLDPTFSPGTGPSGTVRTLVQQPDGKLVVGGAFLMYNGQSTRRLVRLLPSGTVDNTFQVGIGPTGTVTRIRLRATGELLLTGSFASYNGQACGPVARLSTSGVLDASFGVAASQSNGLRYDVLELPGGQLLAGGSTIDYPNGPTTFQNVAYLARLTAVGQLDPAFNLNLDSRGSIATITFLTTGKLLVAGDFSSFNGTATPYGYLHRLNANGAFDTEITPVAPASVYAYYQQFFPQADGRIYALLADDSQATTVYQLVRLLADGSLDTSFTGPTFDNANSYVTLNQVLPQANGTIILTGDFETINGTPCLQLARLQSTGAFDASFNNNPFWNGQGSLVKVLPEPGGTFIVEWASNTSAFYYGLKRVDASGNLSSSFQNNAVITGSPVNFNVVQQPNGQLVVSSGITSYNGTTTPNGSVRLTNAGLVDASFSPAFAGQVMAVQPDGRMLIKRDFSLATCTLRRLEANGSADASFGAVAIPETYYLNDYHNLLLQPSDSKIVLYGSFTTVAGQPRISLARLSNTLLATTSASHAAALSLYPNPAHTTAVLALVASPLARTAQVLDATGRVLRVQAVPSQVGQINLDLSGLPTGLYLVRCGGTAQRLLVE